jgi:hypothetical protein
MPGDSLSDARPVELAKRTLILPHLGRTSTPTRPCIENASNVAIPVLAWQGQFGAAGVLAALVLGEVVVLWLNRWSCPLTAVAARFTDDRRANFDIYLPVWLAQYNKQIFGPLYVAGVVYAVARYLGTT